MPDQLGPIRFSPDDACGCGARRPFGEHLCADCRGLEEQESFLDADHYLDERRDAALES